MLKYRCVLVVVLLVQHLTNVTAQHNRAYNLYLSSGTIAPVPGLELARKRTGIALRATEESGSQFVIIQFFNIPGETEVARLRNAGITLLDYIPNNAYTAIVPGEPDRGVLQAAGVRAILELEPAQKIQSALLGPSLPAHAVREAGKVDVRINYIRTMAAADVLKELSSRSVQVLSENLSAYQLIEARVAADDLFALAGLPWVQYIEAVPLPDKSLNDKSEAATRANILASGLPGQRQLTGDGVTIGIGDAGNLTEHIDVGAKLVSYDLESTYWHGVHVSGTAAGAGIVNEKYKGYAPGASIVKRINSEIWKQAATLVRDFGMVVTNNSYGGSICPDYGSYTFDSYILDRQAGELPNLQHVFAAGNSGLEAPCEGFAAGFGNIIGGSISAKNVISTGRTATNGLISPSSSTARYYYSRNFHFLNASGEYLSVGIGNEYGSARRHRGTGIVVSAVQAIEWGQQSEEYAHEGIAVQWSYRQGSGWAGFYLRLWCDEPAAVGNDDGKGTVFQWESGQSGQEWL